MKHKTTLTFIAWRFYLVLILIACLVTGLIFRVFDLAILNQHFLRHQGDERVLRLVSTPGFRGMIVDRNGSPLAVSTSVYSAWLNPKEFHPSTELLQLLKDYTGVSIADIRALLVAKKDREFAYLKRALSPEVAKKITAMHVPGLYLQEEYRRFYPEGEVTAQVVGFTNIDDKGQEGVELAYNRWLQGEPGKKWVIKDRLGRIISDVQTVQEQKKGQDLILSIDRRIQYLAYTALLSATQEVHADSAIAIVLDARTGEILAMVNQPGFNPNDRRARVSSKIRNRAITDTFEPGSTMKAFTIASLLSGGHYKPDSVINTSPGWIRVGSQLVRDERNNGRLTVAQILQKSSNVGIAKMILNPPEDDLTDLLHQVGFGEITGVGFPGEQEGVLTRRYNEGQFNLATLAFGYGISVTTLQLARAYSVFANEGRKIPISLVKLNQEPKSRQVIDKKIAQETLDLLESVVKVGTGKRAQISGFRVAGKTGTARIVGAHGYEKDKHTALFVGIAPVSQPALIVAVVIHNPQGKKYMGGDIAAPVFAKIMEGALRILAVTPDAPMTSFASNSK